MTERDDIALEQASSPIITSPTILDDEALKAATPARSLADRLAHGKSTAEVMADKPGPKRRGRPPGRKNKATLAKEASSVSPGQRIIGSKARAIPAKASVKDDGLSPEERHELKLKRADKLGNDIADAVNDNIMMVLMAAGCPPELLYLPGMEPKRAKESTKYTTLGYQLALSPMQASHMGRFLAEMETTDAGSKIGGALTDGKGPMILYGMLSLVGAMKYGRNLLQAYKTFEPMLKAYQASKNVQEQHNTNGQGSSNA